jgi:hypothetical protein
MTIRTSGLPLLCVAVVMACASTSPNLTPTKLTGSYALATLTIHLADGGTESASPPQGTGTLALTDSAYKVFAVIDTGASGSPDTVASDSGAYVVKGSMLIETSAKGQGTDTATAMLRSHNDTLDVSVTSPASAAASYVWARID